MGYKYIDSRSRIYLGLNTEIIDSLNLNQDEIIKWAGLNINRTTLSNYIKGISCPPVDVVIKLAVLCKVSINDLLVVKDEYNEEVKASVVEKEITILHKDGKHSKLLRKVNGRNGEFELPVKIKINSYINRKIFSYRKRLKICFVLHFIEWCGSYTTTLLIVSYRANKVLFSVPYSTSIFTRSS